MQLSPGASAGTSAGNLLALIAPLIGIAGGNARERLAGADMDGTAVCWSYSDYTTSPPSGAFTSISAGAYHACGLRENGTTECRGTVDYEGDISVPPDVFTSLSTDGSGGYHTCGLRGGRHIGILGMADAVARQPASIALQRLPCLNRQGNLAECLSHIDILNK